LSDKSDAGVTEDKGSTVLKPGSVIRPFLSLNTAVKIIDRLYGLAAVDLKEFIR
jgi:hypothetical protein